VENPPVTSPQSMGTRAGGRSSRSLWPADNVRLRRRDVIAGFDDAVPGPFLSKFDTIQGIA